MKKPPLPVVKESDTPAEETKKTDSFKDMRDIAFAMAILLYASGWMYIYFYLDRFGLSVNNLDLDLYKIIPYSLNVFTYMYVVGKVYLFIALLIIIMAKIWSRTAVLLSKISPVLFATCFVLILFIAKNAGTYDSENVVLYPNTYLKTVHFIFKESKPITAVDIEKIRDTLSYQTLETEHFLQRSNLKDRLKLLAFNKDEYFVLQSTIGLTKDELSHYVPIIYVVKKEMVKYVRITL